MSKTFNLVMAIVCTLIIGVGIVLATDQFSLDGDLNGTPEFIVDSLGNTTINGIKIWGTTASTPTAANIGDLWVTSGVLYIAGSTDASNWSKVGSQ